MRAIRSAMQLKGPLSCTPEERDEFERLVRLGFGGSDASLPSRILAAQCLAFYRAADGQLTGIAALKRPSRQHRSEVFHHARAPLDSTDMELELGWVFVTPAHRRKGIAMTLCQQLLTRAPGAGIFATTRSGNVPMITLLRALGFGRVGEPFPRRDGEFLLFIRAV